MHYASRAILEQLVLQQLLQLGQHASVRATPADDLESLVCTAFCVTHPDMQVELEKLAKHQLADILSWWQDTAWALDQPGQKPYKLRALRTTPVLECDCSACWNRRRRGSLMWIRMHVC